MIDMKKILFIFAACALLCACGSKPEQKQCPYDEEEFVIHGSVLQSPDSMEPVGITRVRTRAEADSLLDAAAAQGYKPAIKTRECFRECRGEE